MAQSKQINDQQKKSNWANLPSPPGPIQLARFISVVMEEWIVHHRGFFHWQYSGVFIPFFFGTAVGMTLGNKFLLAYLFFILFGAWTICFWHSSDWLKRKKQSFNTRRARKDHSLFKKQRRVYFGSKWLVSGLLATLTLISIGLVYKEQVEHELKSIQGWLIAADDPTPPSPCKNPPEGFKVFFGSNVAYIPKFPYPILIVRKIPRIIIDRNDDGELALTMDIFDPRGIIAEIVKNEFTVNRNNYFKMVRNDRSSLVVFNQSNIKVLDVRYLNESTFRISGEFYYPNYGVIRITNDNVIAGKSGGMTNRGNCHTQVLGGAMEFR